MKKVFRTNPVMDRLIGYQARMISLRLNGAAREALDGFEISPAKVTALGLIAANPGCEQSALARALSINRASAMKLVNVLEEHGLVERRPGRDLRTNALHLTDKAQVDLPVMLARLAESDKIALASLTDKECATLSQLLDKALQPPRERKRR
jgi:DNA-binding MarR family transcriptional regulator